MLGDKRKRRRVGWVITDQLDRGPWIRESWFTSGGVGLARYSWLSQHVNHHVEGWRYEQYRPWRRYDAVVFLKSMGDRAHKLMTRLQSKGVACLFDCNVNYFDSEGTEYYAGMLPTPSQGVEVQRMVRSATAVIADSEFIAEQCGKHNPRTTWIPDAVDITAARYSSWTHRGKRLRLLWSGQAVKLFELLAAEDVLLSLKDHLELVLVTNDLSAMDRLYPDIRKQLEGLLAQLSVTIVPYVSIDQLFSVYANGGVFISPRFLDNRYNFGHTEWKVTLAMACGRIAVCSPVPSYIRVAQRAGNSGIRVCQTSDDWQEEFEKLLTGHLDWNNESEAAREVVERHYSLPVISSEHLSVIESAIGGIHT